VYETRVQHYLHILMFEVALVWHSNSGRRKDVSTSPSLYALFLAQGQSERCSGLCAPLCRFAPGAAADLGMCQDDLGTSQELTMLFFLVVPCYSQLYVVSKEQERASWRFVAFRLLADVLQLFLLIFNSAYGWDFDGDNP
jgi:hypothetical protein